MDYKYLEKLVTSQRLGRYLIAAGNDEEKAIDLYYSTIEIAGLYFGLIALFEVILRNKFNQHFSTQFIKQTNNWLMWVVRKGGEFDKYQTQKNHQEIQRAAKSLAGKGKEVAIDDLVAGLSLGFWVSLLYRHQFRALGKTALSVFINLPKMGDNTSNKQEQENIQREMIRVKIGKIKLLRNRIAHFDNISLSSDNKIDYHNLNQVQNLIIEVTKYLGEKPEIYNRLIDKINVQQTLIQNQLK